MNTESILKKENKFSTFENIEKTTNILANDISIFLAEEIDELNISSHIFRSGMDRSLIRVLNSVIKQEQTILIYPDSIPGFTLMIFKKTKIPANVSAANLNREPNKEMQEIRALDSVINRFFNKSQQKVLIIENIDIIFALFPVADTRKNLKELELYITY